jgi:outer membrane protein TolC
MKLGRVSIVVVLLAFASLVGAQTPAVLGLRQAVESALGNQPSIKMARLNAELAKDRVKETRAERLPTFRISETVTRGNNPVFVFGSLLEQSRFGPQDLSLPALNNPVPITNLRTALSMDLPVFNGMKTSARVAQADIAREQVLLQQTIAEQRIRFEAIRNYYDVVVAQMARQVATEAVRTAEADLKRARDRFDAGLAVQSDMLNAQVQLAELRQRQIAADGNLATALTVLNVSIGSNSAARYQLNDALVAKKFEVPDPEELIKRALLHRPDYAQAELAIRSAERRIAEARGDYFPAVNVFGSFGSSSPNLTTGSTDYAFGAGVTFNLFDPGRASRLDQSQTGRALAKTDRERLADEIVVDVTRAFNAYRAAEQQVRVAEAAVVQAAESLRTIQDRYETGLTTITDLLSAGTALLRARTNVDGSRYAHYIGYASVLLSIGELNDVSAFEP